MIVEHTKNKRKNNQIKAPHYKNLELLYWTNQLQFSREMALSMLNKCPTQSIRKQCGLELFRINSELINYRESISVSLVWSLCLLDNPRLLQYVSLTFLLPTHCVETLIVHFLVIKILGLAKWQWGRDIAVKLGHPNLIIGTHKVKDNQLQVIL